MLTAAPAPANQTTYVIGHKNPDADSICSALAYAAFKAARGETGYVAARCGNSNARIDTILARFNQSLPVYLSDVSPRVRDLMVSEVVTVAPEATCAEALELIDRHNIRLLPVITAQRHVVGTISLPHLGGISFPVSANPAVCAKSDRRFRIWSARSRPRLCTSSTDLQSSQLFTVFTALHSLHSSPQSSALTRSVYSLFLVLAYST